MRRWMMGIVVVGIVLSVGVSSAQQSGPAMPEKVRAFLDRMTGSWSRVDEGFKAEAQLEWDSGKGALLDQGRFQEGSVTGSWSELWSWDAESEAGIVSYWVGSGSFGLTQGRMHGTLLSDTVLAGEKTSITSGKTTTARFEIEFQDSGHVTWKETNRVVDGEKKPDTTERYVITKSTSDEQELVKLATAWENCLVTRDVATLDRLLAEEHTSRGGSDAEFESKEQQLAEVRSGDLKITSVVCEDFQARVYGDMGVTTGIAVYKGHYKDHDISGSYPFTDTWVKRDGRWQCVATHVSKVAEDRNEPAKAVEGLWSMQAQTIDGTPKGRENRKALKFYRDGTFLFVDCDTSTGKIEMAGGGDYTFDGTTLVETVHFANHDEFLPYRGISFNNHVRLEGDIFHQSGDRMGSMLEEVWKRVPPK